VLAALGSLKSTGRLVGADTLSEVCWVLEAALRACRDGTSAATDETLAVLDEGIEMVDALVGAHVGGSPIEGDPRLLEQRLFALLPAAGAARPPRQAAAPPSVPSVPTTRVAPPAQDLGDDLAIDADTVEGDLDLVELFAEEAGDLAEALEEGLHGLEQDPARSAWLMEMRRALRALAAAARHAELPQLNALCEAFDGFLARAAEVGTGVGPADLTLTREATGAVAGVVEALRGRRLPHLPADLIDRLRDATPHAAPRAPAAADAPIAPGPAAAPAAEAVPVEAAPAIDSALIQRVVERASGAGVCHLQLEEQVAVLREQVGRLEGVLALLRRLPVGDAGAGLPPRVAGALGELGGCADKLHETSLAISAQLRAQGHHLTGLQQGLAAVAPAAGPTFADLLLVEAGQRILALPTPAVDSVRRLAPELVPPGGELLELRGRAFEYHHLADLVGLSGGAPVEVGRSQSVVLARADGRAVALGVDAVIGHRSLLVTPAGALADAPWRSGSGSLGGGPTSVGHVERHAFGRAAP
jgi:chemotaxis protein histidine kinase CheA